MSRKLNVGDAAPLEHVLVSADNKTVHLRDLVKDKPAVILFVPFAWTGVCTAELCERNNALDRFGKLSANVVGVSGDSNFVLAKWAEKEHIKIPLLSDYDHAVARAFGVDTRDGFAPAKNLIFKGVSKRSAFVVDTHGTVQYAEVLEDAGQQPDFAAIEATLTRISTTPAALKVGDKAPEFQLVALGDKGPEVVTLASLLATAHAAVLLFVPFAETPVCSEELCERNGALDTYAKLNATVVGIAGDSPFAINQWRTTSHIKLRVLSDYDHVATQAYRVAYNKPMDNTLLMTAVPKRSAFIVDKQGVIQYVEVLEDAHLQPNYAAIEKRLNELK